MPTARLSRARGTAGPRPDPNVTGIVASGQPFRVALIGAEQEENLSLRYLAASIKREGFEAILIPFNEASDRESVLAEIEESRPDVVGISVPFQAHASELLGLAPALRQRGYRGHICAGGHFATFEYDNILRDYPALDSVVRHEGEETLREICVRLSNDGALVEIPGAVVQSGRCIEVGPKRPLPPLDKLPFPDRRGEPHEVMGVRCSPIVGSRGCYADCSFCCIYAYSKNADGPRYRTRSPQNILNEMWEEYSGRGVRLFVFHDDNFLVPSVDKNIARYSRLRDLLRDRGMADISLVIKCRPTDVDPGLFGLLKAMGLIRAYVGIETNSDEGLVSLNRRVTPEDNRRSLQVLRSLDIYCSFNVLIFDPEATLTGIARNLDFMEEFADIPFNFCRTEVYAGTPLKSMLASQGRLRGDYLAWGYEMRDPRVELLFRITTAVFMARNFKSHGVANLNMGIRFDNEVMRRVNPECWDPGWHSGLVGLSRQIGRDSVRHLREALAFVEQADPYDGRLVKGFTLSLSRSVGRRDLEFIGQVKKARQEMEHRLLDRIETQEATDQMAGSPRTEIPTRLTSSTGRDLSTEILPHPSPA